MDVHSIYVAPAPTHNTFSMPKKQANRRSMLKWTIVALSFVGVIAIVAAVSSGSNEASLQAPVGMRTRTAAPLRTHSSKMSSYCPKFASSAASTIRRSSLSPRAMPIEDQKERAKEMIKYYRVKGLERTESNRQVFGWTPNNELLNGRWVMMGLFLGLLTEFATGADEGRYTAFEHWYKVLGDLDAEGWYGHEPKDEGTWVPAGLMAAHRKCAAPRAAAFAKASRMITQCTI
eukprot:jgi/Bigna1/87794/estExt_fgenesh1_pg.C_240128